MTDPHDWTQGGDRLMHQRCKACGLVWYFHRGFCPGCGQADPADAASLGRGTVYASTLVHRAPNDEFRARVPYRLVLVDLDEGFRAMGHGEAGLAIGDRVQCRITSIAGRPLPRFHKDPE
jgi:uncharacterized OB-fold protein